MCGTARMLLASVACFSLLCGLCATTIPELTARRGYSVEVHRDVLVDEPRSVRADVTASIFVRRPTPAGAPGVAWTLVAKVACLTFPEHMLLMHVDLDADARENRLPLHEMFATVWLGICGRELPNLKVVLLSSSVVRADDELLTLVRNTRQVASVVRERVQRRHVLRPRFERTPSPFPHPGIIEIWNPNAQPYDGPPFQLVNGVNPIALVWNCMAAGRLYDVMAHLAAYMHKEVFAIDILPKIGREVEWVAYHMSPRGSPQ